MKNIFVFLMCILILIVGVLSINYVLEKDIETLIIETNTTADENRVFINYAINLDVLNNISNIKIQYDDEVLYVNDNKLKNISYVDENITIYNNSVVIFSVKENDDYEVLIYDSISDSFDRISKYESMSYDINYDIIYEDLGMIITFSNIYDGYLNDVNICLISSNDITVAKSVEYYFDSSVNEFGNEELIFSRNLEIYKNKVQICD